MFSTSIINFDIFAIAYIIIVPAYLIIVNYIYLNNKLLLKGDLSLLESKCVMYSVFILHSLLKILLEYLYLGTVSDLMIHFFYALIPCIIIHICSIFINPDR